MGYLLLILSFLATLIAIKGDTWDSEKTGLKRITISGYLTFFIALCVLIFAAIKTKTDDKKSAEKDIEIQRLLTQSQTINDTINILNDQLRSSRNILIQTNDSLKVVSIKLDSSVDLTASLEQKVETYEQILDKISKESERQPQWDFVNYVSVRSYGRERMPSRLYTGSLLKFVGLFCETLYLDYGDRRIKIPQSPYHQPVEIPIIGPSGQQFSWSLRNDGDEDCDCKIYKMSTPRSRSNRWSWEEERN